MAKAGRKRKPTVKRTPSGQPSRAGKDPRVTVLAQQHRAGRLSEWRGTTIGRLLEDDRYHTSGASKKALHEAATRFGQHYAGWQSALASRRPMAVIDSATPGPEDEAATLDAITRYTRANSILQRLGQPIRQATHDLVCDHHPEDWKPPHYLAYMAVEGLKALAEHYGLDWRSEDRSAA